MTRPAWHSSWKRMRGAGRRRHWMTWSEYQDRLAVLGVSLSPYHLKQATAAKPAMRVHGGKRYLECHVQMAVGYARAKGLARVPDEAEKEAVA